MIFMKISPPDAECSRVIQDIWNETGSINQVVGKSLNALLNESSLQRKADICCLCATKVLCETSFDSSTFSVIQIRVKIGGSIPFLVALSILEAMQFIPATHINNELFRSFVGVARNSPYFSDFGVVEALAKKLSI